MNATELFEEKQRLIAEKIKLQSTLTDLNGRMRVTMPREQYQACVAGRIRATDKIAEIDGRLREIRVELHKASQSEYAGRSASPEAAPSGTADKFAAHIARLNAIRTEYEHFAADATRVSSMRRMASEFVVKLNGAIREALRA